MSEAVLRVLKSIILEAIKEANSPFGAPGGHLYAALMDHITLDTFELVMGQLVSERKLVKEGQCYRLSLAKDAKP